MALGISGGGGTVDSTPYISYDARAGRMFRADRFQNASGMWETSKVDITNVTRFVADMENIRVGWLYFSDQGPRKVLATFGKEPIPARPADLNAEGKPLYRQGFEIDLMLHKDAGGGPARVMASNAGCVIEAIDALHDAYLAAPEAKQGLLPVVYMSGVTSKIVGKSSNYKPTFVIETWVPRPDGLKQVAATAPRPAPAVAAAPAPISPPPAPVPQAAPQAVTSGDFG